MAVVNWLLSPKVQTEMVTKMWQYPAITDLSSVPDEVWQNIPSPEEVGYKRIQLENSGAYDWLQKNGMDVVE